MTMYNEKLVACIKVNGKILREQKEIVHLPLGSEYSIYLKNLNSRKVCVNVEIDSRKVIDELILNPNESCDLERFVEGFSNSSGPKFKFIEKTQQISNFRGDKPEDGLVRISYTFEKEKPIVKTTITRTLHDWTPYPVYPTYPYNYYGNVISQLDNCHIGNSCGDTLGFSGVTTQCFAANAVSDSGLTSKGFIASVAEQSLDGITVEGSNSNQKFVTAYIGELEPNTHVIILKLFGTTSDNIKIETPITVETKIQCKYCGTKSSSYMKFCGSCGARLI